MKENCLLVSEMFAFCCAYITSDLGLTPGPDTSETDQTKALLDYNDLLNTIHPLLDILLQDVYVGFPAGCDINAQAATTLLVIGEIYESIDPVKMPCTLFTSIGSRPTIQLLIDLIYAGEKR